MKKKTCLWTSIIAFIVMFGAAGIVSVFLLCTISGPWQPPGWCDMIRNTISLPINDGTEQKENPNAKALASITVTPINANQPETTMVSQPVAPTAEAPYGNPVFSAEAVDYGRTGVWRTIPFPNDRFQPVQIKLHPTNAHILYVISHAGEARTDMALLVSRNGGTDWELALEDRIMRTFALQPLEPDTLLVSANDELWISRDTGKNWSLLQEFSGRTICVIFVSPINGDMFVVPGWQTAGETGVYRSNDDGQTWTFIPLGASADNLLFWDMAQDPNSGTLFLTSEIADHPKPYQPPFFVSVNNGDTWEERFDLPWHVVEVEVVPETEATYMLTEGAGLFLSEDGGATFQELGKDFGLTMTIDHNNPDIIYGGNHTYLGSGGLFRSMSGGKTFRKVALDQKVVSTIALNADSSSIFIVCYPEGIFIADTDKF